MVAMASKPMYEKKTYKEERTKEYVPRRRVEGCVFT
jgi:hypothetical protein